MKVLLVSTYELGRQPVHLSSPSAALRKAGHEVRSADVSVEPLSVSDLDWADRVGISTPMHTATRLAADVAKEARLLSKPVAAYGLYASLAKELVDVTFAGEYEPELLRWVNDDLSISTERTGRSDFLVPDRTGMASLDEYARLEFDGETKLVGAVEASHGCRHRCRHCPLPVVYDGRLRVVPPEVVVGDIDNLVEAGAEHVTFGDPDFLNAPAHSLSVLESAHQRHPEITFDATIKVSHLLEHRRVLSELSANNLLFIVSAFESVDAFTLDVLDKNHTREDMELALDLVRSHEMYMRPTWLPFMPWTTPNHVADIFDFIVTNDLVAATDPVQLSIKLLMPRGSLLESHPAMTPHLDSYDTDALTWRWSFGDPDADVLQKELELIAANASDCDAEVSATVAEMGIAIANRSGRSINPPQNVSLAPRLTESWFCCSEPTPAQAQTIQIGRN